MRNVYKCSFCGEIYDWYASVEMASGDVINANSFMLKCFNPLPERCGEKLEIEEANGNLAETIFNLCPACMKKLLDQTQYDYI